MIICKFSINKIFLIAILCFLFSISLSATNDNPYKTFHIMINNFKFVTYDDSPTIPLSESISINDSILIKDIDYIMNYQNSSVYLLNNYNNVLLKITYFTYNNSWGSFAFMYKIQEISDSLKTIQINNDPFELWSKNSNLLVSGSKSFSVTVSNQNDLSVNQAMFLKISGEMSDNVMIDAQLNDNQSPITPEGDTRELSSIDQIYFKIYGKQYEIAFGDLDIKFSNTHFINYLNKFEGVKAQYFNKNEFQTAVAISKSKNSSLTFYGINGKQGPYYLRPENNSISVKVISGTETVFLDAIALNRGDDYSIDYDEGSITFTNKNFINENNRIQVNFQYADEQYRKNSYLINSKNIFYDNLSVYTYSIMNVDDKNNPLEYSFTESDIKILKESGDNDVFVSGIQEVGPGFGKYRKVVDGSTEYYEFSTIDSLAIYLITFTYFGSGKGSYRKISSNIYEYVGQYLGEYLPLKKISAPKFKANWDTIIDYKYDNLNFNYEILLSKYDKNTFSSKDNFDDYGYIHQFSFDFFSDEVNKLPFISLITRNKSKYLSTFSEIPSSQNSDFYLLAYPDSLASIYLSPKVNYNIRGKLSHYLYYEWLKNNNFDEHHHYYSELNLRTDSILNKITLKNLYGKQNKVNEDYSQMQDHTVDLLTNYKFVSLNIKDNMTYLTQEVSDSLANKIMKNSFKIDNSYKYNQSSLQLSYHNEFNKRIYDYYRNYNQIYTYSIMSQLIQENHYNSLSYSKKNINYFIKSLSDQKYDLLELKFNNHFFKSSIQSFMQYSVNNLEYYPKIKELQYIGSQGNYDSTGVWLENGGYDWVYFLSGNPEQTIDVKLDFSLNTNLSNYFDNQFLDKIQTESWFLIQENSKDRDKYNVYFFNGSHVMNDSTTVYGRKVLRQIFWYNLVQNKIILKYLYLRDNTLDNRYQQLDKQNILNHEYSLNMNKLNNVDLEYVLKLEKTFSLKNNEKSDLTSHRIIARYNIKNIYIFNSEIEYQNENNERLNYNYTWNQNKWIFREDIMMFLKEHYRINNNIEFSYAQSDFSLNTYLSENKRDGIAYKYNSQLFYKINQYTQLSINYNLNKYPKSDIIHQLNVEVKAEF